METALTEIAERLEVTAREHGPESILPYSYAGTIGQLGFGSMDRRFFHRLGASQLDRTICSAAGGAALLSVYGIKLGTIPQDYAHAGLVIAWGANIHGNNIHLWPFIEAARRNGAKLVVIDPYRTRTAALADEHLAIRPGTDGMLALGLMHLLFRNGWVDEEYLAASTLAEQAAALREHAMDERHAPEAVAAVTGLTVDAIERLAESYGTVLRRTGRPAVIRLNYGAQRGGNGGTATRAVAMLPLLTGAWKYPGGGMTLSTSGSFPFNSNALQMPELMQASPLGRAARVVNMSQLGQALTRLGGQNGDGPPVKALFVYNSNPAVVAPNQGDVLRGLERPDLFTVVHEQFYTDTADYADYLLPATTWAESKDVQGAYGHLFTQISMPAILPPGEARNNVRLFGELARRMGFTEACFDDREDELIDQALATDHPWFAGTTRAALEREGHIPLALPKDSEGRSLPFSTPEWFGTVHGRAELFPLPEFVPAEESRGSGSEYPLEFLPRKADNYMNSTFANHAVHQAFEARTSGVLEMHPDDAASRGIRTGDAVEVFNGRGSVPLRAAVNGQAAAGVVAARLAWNKLSPGRAGLNRLTSEKLTDIGGGATFYSTLVEVRKAPPTGMGTA